MTLTNELTDRQQLGGSLTGLKKSNSKKRKSNNVKKYELKKKKKQKQHAEITVNCKHIHVCAWICARPSVLDIFSVILTLM